jgi:hypothetical protein
MLESDMDIPAEPGIAFSNNSRTAARDLVRKHEGTQNLYQALVRLKAIFHVGP